MELRSWILSGREGGRVFRPGVVSSAPRATSSRDVPSRAAGAPASAHRVRCQLGERMELQSCLSGREGGLCLPARCGVFGAYSDLEQGCSFEGFRCACL